MHGRSEVEFRYSHIVWLCLFCCCSFLCFILFGDVCCFLFVFVCCCLLVCLFWLVDSVLI